MDDSADRCYFLRLSRFVKYFDGDQREVKCLHFKCADKPAGLPGISVGEIKAKIEVLSNDLPVLFSTVSDLRVLGTENIEPKIYAVQSTTPENETIAGMGCCDEVAGALVMVAKTLLLKEEMEIVGFSDNSNIVVLHN